jgi:peptidoglycan/xylan/chitin deacetylase (PgdA/CDA1 family)
VHGRIAAYRARRGRRGIDSGWRGVRILLYHRVARAPGDPLAVDPERFRRQLEGVRRAGLTFIPLRQVYDVLADGDDGRYAVVTLDDGYLDVLEHGEPILTELEVPATVFLPTGIISRSTRCSWYRTPPPFLGWDDVPRLTASGFVEVQPHGVAHFALPNLDDAGARREILDSVADLESRTGAAAHTYSYAAGLYGRREREIVEGSTLRGALTCDAGVNAPGTPLSALRRTVVSGWESDGEFRAILGGALDDPSMVRRARAARASRAGG